MVGEAAKPQALSYREKMSLIDLMIAVGGLTDFAAGNKAYISAYRETASRSASACVWRTC